MDGQDLRAKGFDLIAFIPATKESDVSPAGIVPSGSDSSNDCAQTFPSRAIYEKILAETSTARVKKNTVQKGDASPTLGELATIVHEGRSRSTKQSMRKDPTKATQKVPPSRHQVLSAAETDDIKSVTSWDRALLTETIDDFGWTPLMCAAYAGSTSVVSYLIEHICNKQHLLQANHANSTAAVLAASQGHSEIVDIITSAVALTFRHEHPPEIGIVDAAGGACGHAAPDTGIDTQASDTETIFGDETDNDDGLGDDNEHAGDSPVMRTSIAGVVQPETESALTDTRQDDNAASLHNAKNANGDSIPLSKYVQDRSMSRFCPVCACDYTQSEDEHVSSIAHQMEAARTTSSARMPPFGLQPTNRGYQMLLQQGWEEGGLGAHGQGRLYVALQSMHWRFNSNCVFARPAVSLLSC